MPRVKADGESPYCHRMDDLIEVIKCVTNSREVLPSFDGLNIVTEQPDRCYKRVKGMDTRQRVEEDSLYKYNIDVSHYKEMLESDKHNRSISSLSESEVWDNKIVSAIVDDLNRNRKDIITRFNNSPERVLLLLWVWTSIFLMIFLLTEIYIAVGSKTHLMNLSTQLRF